MKNNRHLSPSKTGRFFSLASLLISIVGYSTLTLKGSLGALTAPLLYMGFGLPFVGLIAGKEFSGCDFKGNGCETGSVLGFIVGILVLMLMYYLIGYYAALIIKQFKGKKT